jgi:chromosome segregation ATPase
MTINAAIDLLRQVENEMADLREEIRDLEEAAENHEAELADAEERLADKVNVGSLGELLDAFDAHLGTCLVDEALDTHRLRMMILKMREEIEP